MNCKKILFSLIVLLMPMGFIAQFHVDVVHFNFQTRSSSYKNHPDWNTQIDNYNCSIFLGKEFKNKNVLFVSVAGEKILGNISQEINYKVDLSGLALASGFQKVSKNEKWATTFGSILKRVSSYNDVDKVNGFQFGGYLLESWKVNDNVKLKAGMYYNREAFGDFFIPLLGIDWRVNDKFKLYGTLPSFYKIEYNPVKDKLYTGLHFKTTTSSYFLGEAYGNSYVRYDEIQLKLFLDCFIYKKIILYAELGTSLGNYQLRYNAGNSQLDVPADAVQKMTPVFSAGLAYRIRFDLQSNK
ncbi:DUF6268 family outer membrane beta-barrel protein [Flavobacterium sp. H122]|uniref:DUF6268 family outer membrane beta-barrel protein n=1 Tax=Flavobacterium sp. H122 TaxID=2529860 RepID=UPI0010A9F462|nr:DUF6268 family outer membrane beta-barrel protein [Flavobacterium sp. H122]